MNLNGYLFSYGTTSAVNGRIEMLHDSGAFGSKIVNPIQNNSCRCFMPVKKGDIIRIAYSGITPNITFLEDEASNTKVIIKY